MQKSALLFSSLLLLSQLTGATAARGDEVKPLPAGFEKKIHFEPGNLTATGRIAFTAHIDGADRLIVYDLETKRFRKLVDSPGNNWFPAWSPDGTKLAFASDRDKHSAIYVSAWDGSNPRRLTKADAGPEDHPAWSPDGSQVVFTYDKGDDSEIGSVSSSGGEISMLTAFKDRNVTPRWRPDGRAISYSTNRFWPGWDVCVYTPAQKQEQCPLSGTRTFCRADWSHSGKFLAYSFGDGTALDIGVLEIATGQIQSITNDLETDYDATWSPDDKYVLYSHAEEGTGIFNIFISDLTDPPRKLISAPFSLRYPSWTRARTIDLEARRILESEGVPPKSHEKVVPSPAPTVTPKPNPKS